MSDNRTEFIILGGIGSAIIISLFLIPSFQADTIFLVNGNNGTPEPCSGNTGLVLAQNLTDLCDVTIISPITNEILSYNGSQWINISSASVSNNATCTNLGSGTILCASSSNNNLNIKSLLGSTNIVLSNSSDSVRINYTHTINLITSDLTVNANHDVIWCFPNSGDVTITLPETAIGKEYTVKRSGIGSVGDCILDIAGNGVFEDDADFIVLSGDEQTITVLGVTTEQWRTIVQPLSAGTGITLTQTQPEITITNSLPEATTSSNLGTLDSTSEGVFASEVGNDLQFKRLLEGTGMSLSSNTTHITITNTGVLSVTSNNNATIGVVPTSGNVVLYPKYELLCQTTLTSSNATISCNGFETKSTLIFDLQKSATGGTVLPALRFNGDSSTNYAIRRSADGGADATVTGTNQCNLNTGANVNPEFINFIMKNISTQDKIGTGHNALQGATGSATAPSRNEVICKWANTSVQISTITVINNGGTGTFNTGSVLTVWGYD